MDTIKFNTIYNDLSNKLISKTAELYQDGVISEDIKYKCYSNSGEYFTELDNIFYEEGKEKDRRVLVNIINDGGIQDSSISIDMYVQIVSIELLCLDEQRDDINTILSEFVADYKNYTYSLSNSSIQLSIDEFPQYSEKFDAHGYEKFTANFTINMIVFPGAFLSNKFALTINGVSVKYNKLTMNRSTELMSDLKRRDEAKFYPNTTGFQIVIEGLYVDNSALTNLLNDCANNTLFNVLYTVQLKDTNNNLLVNDSFYSKDATFVFAYGSIVSWTVTFYTGTTV